MATTEFKEAVCYAISRVGLADLSPKPKQEEALIHTYICHKVFAWFPTGYVKSLCYQLFPFMFDFKLKKTSSPGVERSVVLVLSPLISLMVDQVSSLQQRGVSAGILSDNKGRLATNTAW